VQPPDSQLEHLIQGLGRRAQLLRGAFAKLRGARAGKRFGLGAGIRLYYPACLRVGDDVTIGDRSFLHCLSKRGVSIGSNSSIDSNLWLHCGASVSGQEPGFFEMGSRSYIGCNAVVGASGGIRIGDDVLIGQCVNFHSENHIFQDRDRLIREQGVSHRGIAIEDDVWIGSKATILDGVTIGRGAVVGAGALVTRSIPEYAIALGVPARLVGSRSKKAALRKANP
jgi:acetyltransferase-like isoleucine patch superfamily enzyme